MFLNPTQINFSKFWIFFISRKKDKSEQSYLGVKMPKNDLLTLDENGGRLLNGCRASRDRL